MKLKQQRPTIFVTMMMNHSWAALYRLFRLFFIQLYAWITQDTLGHISRHFLGKYNSKNAYIDQVNTRITDLFACVIDKILVHDLLKNTLGRLLLNVFAISSICFAHAHLAIQIFSICILTCAQISFNALNFIGKNIICEMLILKVIPNLLSVLVSLPICLISSAARKQLSRSFSRLLDNLFSLVCCTPSIISLFLGQSTLKLLYTKNKKDPEVFTHSTKVPYWRQSFALISASLPSLKTTLIQIYENLSFILFTPGLILFTWCNSAILLLRSLSRAVLSPVSVCMPPIQRFIFGEYCGKSSLEALSSVLREHPNAKLPKAQKSAKLIP
ncbi:hypothetical protein OAT84_00475 [Gammaproteobacteria bacterium]|nr:hypothetical protein [Gammaproteobacteria bacterium]